MNISSTVPSAINDPVNARILAVSEDQIQGFHEHPFAQIAEASGVDEFTVCERIACMLRAGVIRRVRQTLMASNLAAGALVAWQVPADRLNEAFDFFHLQDPFSGHVVIRTTDSQSAGSNYRLWTTVKVPQGFEMQKHCMWLAERVGATTFRMMPARKLFALGVGHMRRRTISPGDKTEESARVIDIQEIKLSDEEWRVLTALKRELAAEDITHQPWPGRAAEAGVSVEKFCATASKLAQQGVLGRFSTFLEHVKPLADGERVTRFNGLFHWAVPAGKEIEAGRQVGRFHILTHAYWREGGPEFKGVNIMAVAHGLDKQLLLEHKAAIDMHLAEAGIPVSYTNMFWGGRSEIKPSEIAPMEYEKWCKQMGIDAAGMRA
ncbi:MAG: Lrp/AsnC family transcriptional regulator [Phycisphaerales bacterium]|nr:Lrp/AsnC family transcriptional regulator [Phycisphaerales bacterium]